MARLRRESTSRLRRSGAHSRARLRRLADEELMPLVAASDAEAFEVILERHADAAFSLAYRMCGRRSLAEDVAQESFLALWRSGARYDRTRGSVRTWALGIVHNRAVDTLRRSGVRARRQASGDGVEESVEAPERTDDQALDNAAADEIRNALGVLPADQRRVIELAYFGGFTHTEIASMLDTPVGTVKGRMRLGLQKLRAELRGWEAVQA
jgi:RNA polymerase sigma-70 factor (ECF subfamily)